MKKRSRFKIGDWVVAKAYVEFAIDEGERRQFRFEKEIHGQICGAKCRYIGKYVLPSYDEEAGYIRNMKGIMVWLVRIGMTNKPIEILDEDIMPAVTELREGVPWRYTRIAWSSEERKVISEYSKDFPRDERGRFV